MKYKFLREGLKSNNGNCKWKVGEWKEHEGDISLCNSGFHCSDTILDAFYFVQGEILATVSVKGKSLKEKDKSVHQKMKIDKAYKWQKKDSVALSIFSAELVLKNFEKIFPKDKRPREAIEAAKKWLKNPTKENESAAWSAWSAESAARSAESAWSAARSARSAAWSAESARSAAWSARSAAWSAWSAARSAESAWWAEKINKKIEKWLKNHIKELEIYG